MAYVIKGWPTKAMKLLGPIIITYRRRPVYNISFTLHVFTKYMSKLLESPICTYFNWYVIMVVMSQSITHHNRGLLEENKVLYQKVKGVLEKTQEEKV